MMNADVCDMLPIPAIGDTIPPAMNPDAPTIAEEAPIALRPAFMASVVTEGIIVFFPTCGLLGTENRIYGI